MHSQQGPELSEEPVQLGSKSLHNEPEMLPSSPSARTEKSHHRADGVRDFLPVGERLCGASLVSVALGSIRKFSSGVSPCREISTMSSQKLVNSFRERVRTSEPSAISTRRLPLSRAETVTFNPYLFNS